jgi:hypothetical protein
MGNIALLAVAFLVAAGPAWPLDSSLRVSSRSREVSQGGIGEIQLTGTDLTEVKGQLGQQEVLFFREEKGIWRALLGIDLDEPPGPLKVVVQGRNKDQFMKEMAVMFQVKKRVFPMERISVPPSFDQIDEALKKTIEREQQRFDGLWRAVPRQRLWKESFISPTPIEITSPFGLRRIVNGSVRSPHGGIDLKAALGTEVRATNEGVVALRDEFFFTGKSLVLDHGGGLFSMYFHLEDFRVPDGAPVRRGEVIGLAGMTGRVTGPHLHWGIRLNGARVDPMALPGIKTGKE